ncbi:MAG: rhodanese-like domain-containing protein [Deltaproteobacteria bacterium]|jgi:thiosulfate/3-mercaptopyruvate sulfurtransferase
MKSKTFFAMLASILILSLIAGCASLTGQEAASGRKIEPIASTDWLAANRHLKDLVLIDIRSPDAYAAGHIPGSINEPFATAFDPCTGPTSNWIIGGKDCLWLELPDANDLMRTIGKLGITGDSRVVIVTAPNPKEPPYFGLANATRVADTLIYAGVANVAILDGGYPKWVAEKRPIDKEVPALSSTTYQAAVNEAMFVPINDVKKRMSDAIIIDARDAVVYAGAVTEPFADKPGHIPNARSLPAPWIWNENPDGTYTYKDSKTLGTMASGVAGDPGSREIIVYCGVGGYASSWWFVLTQALGYQNVKIYDGAAQEWVKHYDMVVD